MLYFLKGDYPLLDIESNKIIKEIISKERLSEKFFDASSNETEKFIENVSTNSIFGENDILILKRAESLKSSGIDKLLKSVSLYDTVNKKIIIIYEEKKSFGKILKEYEIKKSSIKNIEMIGQIVDCSSEAVNKKMLIFIKNKVKMSDEDAIKLLDMLGLDFHKVENELNKIINFLDGETFSLEKVRNILSVDEVYNLKDLVENFLTKKDGSKLLHFLKENPENINSCLYMLTDELVTLAKINSLIDENIFSKNMDYNKFKTVYTDYAHLFIGRNGLQSHPYPIFLKLTTLNIRDNKFVLKKLRELQNIEYAIKSGEAENEIIFSFILNF